MSDETLEQAIEENAKAPASASADGTSVTQHSLKDQIEADKYLAAKRAARGRRLPIRFTRTEPPGAV